MDCPLVQISTDYVFGGDRIQGSGFRVQESGDRRQGQPDRGRGTDIRISSLSLIPQRPVNRPYREDDPPAPQGVYARTKLEGELAAATVGKTPDRADLRTVRPAERPTGGELRQNHAPAGQRRGNEVAFRSAKERHFRGAKGDRPPLRVVADQHCTPSYVPHVARAVLFLLGCRTGTGPVPVSCLRRPWGIYHVTNRGQTTWYEFAAEIFRLAGMDVSLQPITTAEYGAAAPRPAYSVLDTSAYHRLGGPACPSGKRRWPSTSPNGGASAYNLSSYTVPGRAWCHGPHACRGHRRRNHSDLEHAHGQPSGMIAPKSLRHQGLHHGYAPKVALITGSGKAPRGQCHGPALAERGYAIALHYNRSAEDARETVEQLERQGVAVRAFQADVADETQVDRLFREVHDHFGRLDVLVTAAAVWNPKPLEETTAADVRRQFDINALGTFLCCRRAGLIMAGQPEGGAIVTIGDWAVERPYPGYAAYFLSKGTIPTLTRMLAVELARRNRRARQLHPARPRDAARKPLAQPEVQGAVAGTARAGRRERRPGRRLSGRKRLRHRRVPAGGRRADDRLNPF